MTARWRANATFALFTAVSPSNIHCLCHQPAPFRHALRHQL